MKILYSCPFSLELQTGKNRATRQKLDALESILNEKLIVFSLETSSGNNLLKFFHLLKNEISLLHAFLIKHRDVEVFFSRGIVGLLVTPFLKYFGIISVREIHAAPGEFQVMEISKTRKMMLKATEMISYYIDKKADMRVYNHPNVKEYYQDIGAYSENDIILYNGADFEKKNLMKRDEAIEHFNLPSEKKILVFIGSNSPWHGTEYLIDLQEQFDLFGDQIQVVIGGGSIDRKGSNIINFSPLYAEESDRLIIASNACLLPVNDIRVSPGSPLKLYDYISLNRVVIGQQKTLGYSDEIDKYNLGITVDFRDAISSRNAIVDFLENSNDEIMTRDYSSLSHYISWKARMESLLKEISKLKKTHDING